MVTKTFQGGVALHEEKSLTVDKRIKTISPPGEIVLPLSQHIGSPNEAIVKMGDALKMGCLVGEAKAFISAPLHSPVSGKVKAIRNFVNPVYGNAPAVIIENDGRDEGTPFHRRENPGALSKDELIEIVKNAGLVGMGGAAFPTHVKLNIPKGKNVDTLIVNGAECEPYLTCDHRLMVERTGDILKGVALAARALGVKNVFMAIEENKMSAIFAMQKASRERSKDSNALPVKVIILKTKYPQGGEKQLIKAVLKREVPPGKLPLDVGALVQNVGTCLAIYEAAYLGKPLIERCVTLTGGCLNDPGNFLVRLGTPLKYAVEKSGGFREEPAKIISGGPMMGIAQYTLDVPIVKGMTGVVFLSKKEAKAFDELACIRCAKCVDVCPVNMMPTEIMRMVKHSRWYYMEKLHPSDCVECGACAYSCPSRIPLVQYIKLAKAKEAEKK